MKRSILNTLPVIIAASVFISFPGQQKAIASCIDPQEPDQDLTVVVKPGTSFATGDTITIMNKLDREDAAGIEGILTNQLMKHGFHVISGSSARTVYKYVKESTDTEDSVNEVNAELYRVIELNTVYVLEFSGKVYLDFLRLPRHYDFTSFSASVTDITTGEIVISGNFTGNRPVGEVCREFVDKMVAALQ